MPPGITTSVSRRSIGPAASSAIRMASVGEGASEHPVAGVGEDPHRELAHRLLVLDHQHRAGPGHGGAGAASRPAASTAAPDTRGRQIVNVVPRPGSLATRIAPPVWLTMP